MKRLVALAVLLAASAAARSARADSCHGEAGGTHSSGGDSASATGSSCTEESDVVGHQRCGHFGAWSDGQGQPPLTAEIGFFTRELDTGFGASGVMEHDTGSFAYNVASRDERGTAAGATIRLGLALPAHLYVGTDLEIGALVSGSGADVEMTGASAGSPVMSASQAMYVGAGGVAGVRGRLGPAILAAEVVAGTRVTTLSVESSYGACEMSDSHHHYRGFVEPRVKLDFWLSPWLTVAGFAGSDLRGDSRMVGASLAFHVRAFDGGR